MAEVFLVVEAGFLFLVVLLVLLVVGFGCGGFLVDVFGLCCGCDVVLVVGVVVVVVFVPFELLSLALFPSWLFVWGFFVLFFFFFPMLRHVVGGGLRGAFDMDQRSLFRCEDLVPACCDHGFEEFGLSEALDGGGEDVAEWMGVVVLDVGAHGVVEVAFGYSEAGAELLG